jgi:hypothetical protein
MSLTISSNRWGPLRPLDDGPTAGLSACRISEKLANLWGPSAKAMAVSSGRRASGVGRAF